MFRTHSSTSLGSRTNENDCFYWSCVEHTLALPWFYITLKSHESRATTMLQVMDPGVFSELLAQHEELLWIEDVQLVSPPYMNGSSAWKMEALLRFSYCHSPDLGSFELYELECGKTYTTLEPEQLVNNDELEKTEIYKKR